MPRIARVVAAGYPHHITHRGNYQQIVFEEEDDFIFYSKLIESYSRQHLLSILGYCLMPNHVHFIVVPEEETSLAKTFNVTQMVHAQYMNKKRKITGHLWQGRFYSCILDEKHLYAAVRYVENNPVRAGLVAKAWDWKWSSVREHMGVGREKGIIGLKEITDLIEVGDWKDFLSELDEETFLTNIRKNTSSGRPFGDKVFVEELEKNFKRSLLPLPIGRPSSRNKDS